MVPSLRRLIRGAAPAVCSTPAPLLLPPPHTADGTDQLCKEAQANLPNNPDILVGDGGGDVSCAWLWCLVWCVAQREWRMCGQAAADARRSARA